MIRGIFLILDSSASQILTGNYQRGLQVFNDSFKAMKYTVKNKFSLAVSVILQMF